MTATMTGRMKGAPRRVMSNPLREAPSGQRPRDRHGQREADRGGKHGLNQREAQRGPVGGPQPDKAAATHEHCTERRQRERGRQHGRPPGAEARPRA